MRNWTNEWMKLVISFDASLNDFFTHRVSEKLKYDILKYIEIISSWSKNLEGVIGWPENIRNTCDLEERVGVGAV